MKTYKNRAELYRAKTPVLGKFDNDHITNYHYATSMEWQELPTPRDSQRLRLMSPFKFHYQKTNRGLYFPHGTGQKADDIFNDEYVEGITFAENKSECTTFKVDILNHIFEKASKIYIN